MIRYRKSYPWRGTLVERVEKLRKLHRALCKAYSTHIGLVIDVPERETKHGNGCYIEQGREIVLSGKLSVLTYLHEFAHATVAGLDEFKACGWSVNLYKRIFPVAWRKMKFDGHLVVKANQKATNTNE
jgi:hypothetical protein